MENLQLTATDIARYFLIANGKRDAQGIIRPKSIGDFIGNDNQKIQCLFDVYQICRRLEAENILVPAGSELRGAPPLNNNYYCYRFDDNLAEYGTYEFLCFGFPYIRNYFSKSVFPIIVEREDGTEDIGTGFLVSDRSFTTRGFTTAAHCIKGMRKIYIPGWSFDEENLAAIHVSLEENVDLAFLKFNTKNPFDGVPGFLFREGNILEDIITMGYPPIPGFESVLVAEKAHISGYLSSTVGQLTGLEQSYLDKQTYFLFTARIKGGNSGGPIVGKDGFALGVVAQIPAGAEGRADLIGYGIATPSNTFISFIESCFEGSDSTKLLDFEFGDNYISTS
ncbi:MAG: S1 family peptidase [Thainema sp.]